MSDYIPENSNHENDSLNDDNRSVYTDSTGYLNVDWDKYDDYQDLDNYPPSELSDDSDQRLWGAPEKNLTVAEEILINDLTDNLVQNEDGLGAESKLTKDEQKQILKEFDKKISALKGNIEDNEDYDGFDPYDLLPDSKLRKQLIPLDNSQADGDSIVLDTASFTSEYVGDDQNNKPAKGNHENTQLTKENLAQLGKVDKKAFFLATGQMLKG